MLAIDRGTTARLAFALALSGLVHLSLLLGVTVVKPEGAGAFSVLKAQLRTDDVNAWSETAIGTREQQETSAVHMRAQRERVQTRPRHQSAEGVAAMAGRRASDPVSPLPPLEMPLLTDTNWYGAQDLDTYPRPLEPVRPLYPLHAERQVVGMVTLLVSIDESGRVQEVSVVDATPAGLFEEAAVAALRAAQFTPARRDGRDVRSRIALKLSFAPSASSN